MKTRFLLLPLVLFGVASAAGACSSDSSTTNEPGSSAGTTTEAEGGGSSVGATSSNGGSQAGANSTAEGGMTSANGGAKDTAGMGGGGAGAGGAGVDRCETVDLNCEDDNNPCTEDVCNPETGKCGIPRSNTECDDGLYCNGADTCDAGECSQHAGNPCSGTCNEPGKYCECSKREDCPADEPGDWSECTYGSTCVKTGSRSRPVTKYTCNNVGKCVSSAAVENEACNRVTDGNLCEDDGLRCDGTEKCKNGNCAPDNVKPCAGTPSTPYCYESGTECRECTSSSLTGSPNMGCGSGEYCCGGVCQSSTCKVIISTLVTTISPTLATFAAPAESAAE